MGAVFHQAFPACCISAVISGLDSCCLPGGPGLYTNVSVFQQNLSSPQAVGEVGSCCPAWWVQRWVHTRGFY